VSFIGKLRFDAAQEAFYLNEPYFVDLGLANLPPSIAKKALLAVETTGKEIADSMPLYRLKTGEAGKTREGLVLQKVEFADRKRVLTLGGK
jgi:hypothetical protein